MKVLKILFGWPIDVIGSLTSSLYIFVDCFSRPLVENLPPFSKDTKHIVTNIESIGPISNEEEYLVSYDVNPMYTSITPDGGIGASEYFLSKHDIIGSPSQNCLLELTNCVKTQLN